MTGGLVVLLVLALACGRAEPEQRAERARRRVPGIETALVGAAPMRDLLERGYDAGYLSLADVLVQEDRLLQVRAGAIDAWLDLHDAEAEVIEAAGAAP